MNPSGGIFNIYLFVRFLNLPFSLFFIFFLKDIFMDPRLSRKRRLGLLDPTLPLPLYHLVVFWYDSILRDWGKIMWYKGLDSNRSLSAPSPPPIGSKIRQKIQESSVYRWLMEI